MTHHPEGGLDAVDAVADAAAARLIGAPPPDDQRAAGRPAAAGQRVQPSGDHVAGHRVQPRLASRLLRDFQPPDG